MFLITFWCSRLVLDKIMSELCHEDKDKGQWRFPVDGGVDYEEYL